MTKNVNHVQSKIETLESQKEELEDSMNASDHQTMFRREMAKIREEGIIKENSVTDTHKVIYEAEKRVAKMSKKDIYKYDKEKEQTESEKMQEELEPLPLCPMADD